MSTVNAISNAPTSAADLSSVLNPSSTLTQADYLKLLVTQMTSQDPLNPQSDTAFAAQLAQFSALQSSQATQATAAEEQAANLIGRTVSVTDGDNIPVSGVVSAVQLQNGTPELIINGAAYDLNQVSLIQPTTTNTSTQTPPTP